MRQSLLVVALPAMGALAGACGAVRSGSTTAGLGSPFTMTSLGGSHGIQARLDGFVAIRDRWVHVAVPRGAVRTYQLDRQDYWDLRLRAGVATCRGRDFDVTSEGRAARLAPLLGLSRDAARLDTTLRSFRDTLRLDVGVPPGTDLARSWLAFILEWPFENAMATYTIHTDVPLDGVSGRWTGREAAIPAERCR